ncbi:MAG: hypothetical protein HY695_25210 [Deltaproteobacteria bacterium]|nr:hypothetical protein [Deltaproteobacteria bacterium]
MVTERGKPIAFIHPLDEAESQTSIEERMAVLGRQGLIRLPTKKGRFDLKTPPIKAKGKPASRIVIENRRVTGRRKPSTPCYFEIEAGRGWWSGFKDLRRNYTRLSGACSFVKDSL